VSSTVTVRRLRADEADVLRTLRLRALRDSPAAFGQTYAEISAEPDSYWAEMTRSVTDPDRHAMFLAEEGTAAVGLCFGLVDHERADRAHLGGMWVAPQARRRGAGQALVDAVLAWARERHFADIVLWVTEGNAEAAALYERHGFRPTGRSRPLPSNPGRAVHEMGRTL
jgi:ribosomal protein S18 acetylase RimI-like enzyme